MKNFGYNMSQFTIFWYPRLRKWAIVSCAHYIWCLNNFWFDCTSVLCSDAVWFSGPELISDSQKDSGNVCCGQMSPCFSLFLGKTDIKFSVLETKGTMQTFTSDRCKRKTWHGIFAKVPLTWRHILGLYRDINCHQDDIFHGKSMDIRSRQCQVSFCMCYNSVVS